MPLLAIFVSGLLFGAGLTLSGMVNPMKILNFLDLAGIWDPTLLFVMAGGLLVTFLGYRAVLARRRPIFAERFTLPASELIDARLVGGAALFGLGWGLTGFCPGPAVASLVFGRAETLIFVIAMAAGMLVVRFAKTPTRSEEVRP
jgi:uncharacterized membrane protein YedE/YeeE